MYTPGRHRQVRDTGLRLLQEARQKSIPSAVNIHARAIHDLKICSSVYYPSFCLCKYFIGPVLLNEWMNAE